MYYCESEKESFSSQATMFSGYSIRVLLGYNQSLISFPICTCLAESQQISQLQSLICSVNPCAAGYQPQEQMGMIYIEVCCTLQILHISKFLLQHCKPLTAKILTLDAENGNEQNKRFQMFWGVLCFRGCVFFHYFLEKN